jgi:hypothetical protein
MRGRVATRLLLFHEFVDHPDIVRTPDIGFDIDTNHSLYIICYVKWTETHQSPTLMERVSDPFFSWYSVIGIWLISVGG